MKLIILGCGSSLGSPWITNHWGNCDTKNNYNRRTRCSVFIQKGNLSVLIDTSPDIKEQFLKNNIKDLDHVLLHTSIPIKQVEFLNLSLSHGNIKKKLIFMQIQGH